MIIRTNVRAGLRSDTTDRCGGTIDRCGGSTRCGGTTRCGGSNRCGGSTVYAY